MVLKQVIDLESDLLIEIYSTRDEIKIFKFLNLTQYLESYTHLKWLHFMCKKNIPQLWFTRNCSIKL